METLSLYPDPQQDEFTVLQSIYGEDFREIKGNRNPWQSRPNLAFEVRIRANHDEDISVLLHFELPPEWPKVGAMTKIKEIDANNRNARAKIENILKTSKLEPSVFGMCDMIQEVIEDAAESRARRKDVPSLEEERVKTEADTAREAEALRQRLEHITVQKRQEESASVSKAVERIRRKQNQGVNQSNDDQPDQDVTEFQIPVPVDFNQYMTITGTGGDKIKFNSVWGSYVILQTAEKKATIVTPLVKGSMEVPRILLKEIHIDGNLVSHPENLEATMRTIEALLEDSRKHRHRNVIDIIGYKVQTQLGNASWHVSVLSEFANKGPLSELLDVSGNLSGSKIRSWTSQILDALAYFDDCGYVHPAVHLRNILLCRSHDGSTTVKLSDGYGPGLRELVMEMREANGIHDPPIAPGWLAPELLKKIPVRTNKTCIWELGVVVMQMISGKDVLDLYTSPASYIAGNNLTTQLEDMLEKMCDVEQRYRDVAFNMSSTEFLRGDGNIFNETSPTIPSLHFRRGKPGDSFAHFETSDWATKWEETGKLGRGGFGEVVKARNLVDSNYYAVKIIKTRSQDDLGELLREIKLLSVLNSPRIVRYYNTWLEVDKSKQKPPDESESTYSDFRIPSIQDMASTGHHQDQYFVEGHDFLSASGNVGIQFGTDSDDGEGGFFRAPSPSDDTEDEIDDPGLAGPPSPQNQINRYRSYQETVVAQPQILYIVMELCEQQSLRGVIKSRILEEDPAEVWRLFSQIVEGLAYIHAKGLIHRDLKPDNIFMVENSNIRIGDFGLATRGRIPASHDKEPATMVAGPESRSIGTSLYVAPELRSDGKGYYSSKVDMYALGITFLEMCICFDTISERHDTIVRVRNTSTKLPNRFEMEEWLEQGSIISKLLAKNDIERPSAAELLQSGDIPDWVDDEKMHQYILSIANGSPANFIDLVGHFFDLPMDKAQDLAWDTGSSAAATQTDMILSSFVNEKLQTIFRRHCGVDMSRQGALPLSPFYSNPATFLDSSGMVLQMPYDLTLPFARYLARTQIEIVRSYTFGVVYRKGLVGGQPSRLSEVDFDIVSHSSRDLGLKEAEVLKVLDEVLGEFPSLRSKKSIVILLNHADLLDIILTYCRIEEKQKANVFKVLTKLNTGTTTWRNIASELRGPALNVVPTNIEALLRFNFQGSPEECHIKLETIFGNISDERKRQRILGRLEQIFARFSDVITCAAKFKVKTKIVVHPLSNNSEYLYRGSITFQCLDGAQKKVLAVGGRYDSLIQGFLSRNQRTSPRAVGLRLNVSDLVDRVKADIRHQSKTYRPVATPRRCNVLVTSLNDKTLATTCLDIITELWASDISAELTDHYQSLEELALVYKREDLCIVVSVRDDNNSLGGRTIKVRTLGRKDDVEVRSTELVNWIKDRQAADSSQPRVKVRRDTNVGDQSLLTADFRNQGSGAEVIIVTPKHKAKKINRHALIEDAALLCGQTAQSFLIESPVVAIDTTTEAHEGIRNTRLNIPESWRSLIQSVPIQEGPYLKDVQQELQRLADEGKKAAWIYNQRNRGCIYYDFGKTT